MVTRLNGSTFKLKKKYLQKLKKLYVAEVDIRNTK